MMRVHRVQRDQLRVDADEIPAAVRVGQLLGHRPEEGADNIAQAELTGALDLVEHHVSPSDNTRHVLVDDGLEQTVPPTEVILAHGSVALPGQLADLGERHAIHPPHGEQLLGDGNQLGSCRRAARRQAPPENLAAQWRGHVR